MLLIVIIFLLEIIGIDFMFLVYLKDSVGEKVRKKKKKWGLEIVK